MNQVLLISHNGFAHGAKQATELILGEQSHLHVVELDGEKGINVFKKILQEKIKILSDSCEKLLILSDLKNGTPYNVAMEIIIKQELWNKLILISGMNLNLILEVIMAIEEEISSEQLNDIQHNARDGIYYLQPATLTTFLNVGDE